MTDHRDLPGPRGGAGPDGDAPALPRPDDVSAADLATLREQLGREPRGVVGVDQPIWWAAIRTRADDELFLDSLAGRDFFLFAPHIAVIPSVLILVIVLAVNVAGDALRDVLDPRLQS